MIHNAFNVQYTYSMHYIVFIIYTVYAIYMMYINKEHMIMHHIDSDFYTMKSVSHIIVMP